MIYVGLVLFVVAAILVFFMRKNQAKSRQIKATETAQISDVIQMAETIRADMGGGPSLWTEKVELKGEVVCDQPLQGQFTDMSAAVVHTKIVREWEEYRKKRDQNGNVNGRWTRRSRTLVDEVRTTRFSIDDGTGSIRVAPDGADFTLHEAISRFEPADGFSGGASINVGPITLSLGGGAWGQGQRLLGHRITESVLPVGSQVYALGELQDQQTSLVLQKSSDSSSAFILSVKSEEELLAGLERTTNMQKYGAIAAAVIGAGLSIGELFI